MSPYRSALRHTPLQHTVQIRQDLIRLGKGVQDGHERCAAAIVQDLKNALTKAVHIYTYQKLLSLFFWGAAKKRKEEEKKKG